MLARHKVRGLCTAPVSTGNCLCLCKWRWWWRRLKVRIDLYGNPSQSYGDHTVLPATRHKWTRPALTPASQAGTWFTYPGGMEGWVDLGSLIAARPEIEPTTAWSQVRRPNRNATKPTTTIDDWKSMVSIIGEHAYATQNTLRTYVLKT